MKDIKEIQEQISKEIKVFKKTGKAETQHLWVELDGLEAIMIRAILLLSKNGEQIQNIKSAIKLGSVLMNNQLIEESKLC